MKRQRPSLIMIVIVLLMFAGCYPQGPEFVEDLDIVLTNRDKEFDFKTIKTYAIPDKVVKITGNLVQGEDVEYVNDEYGDLILGEIKDNMASYGWTLADKDDADVIILPSAMQTTTVYWYYDYWYWDWYYPYYWWGWYYPYPITPASYTSGSVLVQMTYPGGISATDNVPIVWSALLNGLLEGSTSQIDDRIEDGIRQAYIQSPYLNQK